jgi:hypothetical protein
MKEMANTKTQRNQGGDQKTSQKATAQALRRQQWQVMWKGKADRWSGGEACKVELVVERCIKMTDLKHSNAALTESVTALTIQ